MAYARARAHHAPGRSPVETPDQRLNTRTARTVGVGEHPRYYGFESRRVHGTAAALPSATSEVTVNTVPRHGVRAPNERGEPAAGESGGAGIRARDAGVAQWQSTWLPPRTRRVRFPPPAPCPVGGSSNGTSANGRPPGVGPGNGGSNPPVPATGTRGVTEAAPRSNRGAPRGVRVRLPPGAHAVVAHLAEHALGKGAKGVRDSPPAPGRPGPPHPGPTLTAPAAGVKRGVRVS